jgi:cytochrome c556
MSAASFRASSARTGMGEYTMMRTMLVVAALTLGVSAATAQDPIAARKALMKATGGQSAQGAKFMRGEEAFDLAKAQAIFAQFQKTADEGKALWPDNSKTGGETASLATVWEKKADFEARLVKLGADAKEASAKVKDADSFKAVFPEVAKNCGGCHETYRAKRS